MSRRTPLKRDAKRQRRYLRIIKQQSDAIGRLIVRLDAARKAIDGLLADRKQAAEAPA